MIELEHVVLRIEVDDRVGADAGGEDETVIARAADRHRNGLADVLGVLLE
jgi:hypothetical protein